MIIKEGVNKKEFKNLKETIQKANIQQLIYLKECIKTEVIKQCE